MSDRPVTTADEGAARRALAGTRRTVRPVYDVLFGEPVKEGRLRLAGTSRSVRVLAVAGLAGLALMLASLLFSQHWRTGHLISLGSSFGRQQFVPGAVLSVTALSLALAWVLVTWGAVHASLPIRLAVVVLYPLINSGLGKPESLPVNFALHWGPVMCQIAFWAVPGLLVAYTVLGLRPETQRRLRPVALAAVTLGVLALFGGHLWTWQAEQHSGTLVTVPSLYNGAIDQVANVLIPTVFLAAIAVIQFSYDLADAAVVPLWRLGRPIALGGLVIATGLALWIQLFRHLHQWGTYISQRPALTARTAFMALVLVAGVFALRRLHARKPAVEGAKEAIIYAGVLLLSLTLLIEMVIFAIQELALLQFSWAGVIRAIPSLSGTAIEWLPVAFFLAALATGIVLAVREPHPAARDAGFGIILVAAWVLLFSFPEAFHYEPGFDATLLVLMLTCAIAVFAAVRLPKLSAHDAVFLTAVVLFLWLVGTNGDFLTNVGSIVGLSSIVVFVFGVGYTLLADSDIANADSRLFPRSSRLLIYVGYLVLAVTVLNWVTVTHGEDLNTLLTQRAFELLGLPIAAWMIARRPFAPAEEEPAEDDERIGVLRLPRRL